MKTLVIHPLDDTTDFLEPIYSKIPNKTVIRAGVSRLQLINQIFLNDRILMMVHGTEDGLLSVGKFLDTGFYVVDQTLVSLLKAKGNSVFIWCHADKFVSKFNLSGFCTGMFISELDEAIFYGYTNISQSEINESNDTFSLLLSQSILCNSKTIFKKVRAGYSKLANSNQIAKFNYNRLHLTA